VLLICWGFSIVIALRLFAPYVAAIAGLVVLQPLRANAEWWHRGPVDYEECADAADKSATKEQKAAALTECNAKFAGRRKPGGGYTYYDFMQDRSFDIAGPNPTVEEQKRIDEQYTVYLESQRRSNIAAAFAAKQEQQKIEQASLKSEVRKVPLPQPKPPQASSSDVRSRLRTGDCTNHEFSCEWPLLSEKLNDLKKLFTSQPKQTKKADRS
jgi:hypothetical protein